MRVDYKSVLLTPDDFQQCKEVSHQLAINNRQDGSVECAPDISRRDRFALLGAIGETAFCRYLGVEPDFTRMKASEGRGDIDVDGLWEIRATERNACGWNGSPLTLYEHNLKKRKTYFSPFVKVCVRMFEDRPPRCDLYGWEMGYIIINEEPLKPRRIGVGNRVVERDDDILRPFVDPTTDRENALYLKQLWLHIHNNLDEGIF